MTVDELLFNSGFSPVYGQDCIRIIRNDGYGEVIFEGSMEDIENTHANLLTCKVDYWYSANVNGTFGIELYVDGTDDEIYPFVEEEYR